MKANGYQADIPQELAERIMDAFEEIREHSPPARHDIMDYAIERYSGELKPMEK